MAPSATYPAQRNLIGNVAGKDRLGAGGVRGGAAELEAEEMP